MKYNSILATSQSLINLSLDAESTKSPEGKNVAEEIL